MKQKKPEVIKTSRVDVCVNTHTHTDTHRLGDGCWQLLLQY